MNRTIIFLLVLLNPILRTLRNSALLSINLDNPKIL